MTKVWIIEDKVKFLEALCNKDIQRSVEIFIKDREGKHVDPKIKSVKCIQEDYFPKEFKEQFVKDYLEHIEDMVKKIDSKIWWGTWIASKNRFNGEYFYQLYELIQLTYILKSERSIILAYMRPEPICRQLLINYCHTMNIEVRYFRKNLTTINLGKIARECYTYIANIKTGCRFIVKSILAKYILRNQWNQIRSSRKKYHIIRSFIYDFSCKPNGIYDDAYFGKLCPYLIQKGNDLLIVGKILGHYRDILVRMKSLRNITVLPEEIFFGFKGLSAAFLTLIRASLISVSNIYFQKVDVTILLRNALQYEIKNNLFAFMCQNEIANTLAKKQNIDKLYLTHENNPWERMYIMAFKKYSPRTCIIGYHHSVVTPSHLGLRMQYVDKENIQCRI